MKPSFTPAALDAVTDPRKMRAQKEQETAQAVLELPAVSIRRFHVEESPARTQKELFAEGFQRIHQIHRAIHILSENLPAVVLNKEDLYVPWWVNALYDNETPEAQIVACVTDGALLARLLGEILRKHCPKKPRSGSKGADDATRVRAFPPPLRLIAQWVPDRLDAVLNSEVEYHELAQMVTDAQKAADNLREST